MRRFEGWPFQVLSHVRSSLWFVPVLCVGAGVALSFVTVWVDERSGYSLVSQSPAAGAAPLLMAATADLPGGTYVGPGGPAELRGAPRVVGTSRLARDPEAARRFWEIAQDATGVAYP